MCRSLDTPSLITGSGINVTGTVRIGGNGCISNGLRILCDLVGNLNLPRRWYRNDVLQASETGNSLTLPADTVGTYRCEVSNECDMVSASTVVRGNRNEWILMIQSPFFR